MSDNSLNIKSNDLISLTVDLVRGFVILLLYLQLCCLDIFPIYRWFYDTDNDIINYRVYSLISMYFVIAYAIYSFFVIICFAIQNSIVFLQIKRMCVYYKYLYMKRMLLFTILLFPAIYLLSYYILDNTIEKPFYLHLKFFILKIYISSVTASLFIIPVIVLTSILQQIYRLCINGCSEEIYNSSNNSIIIKNNSSSTNYIFFRFIFDKQNIIGEFLYRYSLLVLWSVLGILLLLFYIFSFMDSFNGYAGIIFFVMLKRFFNVILMTILYFIFSIVIRRLLRWFLLLIKLPCERVDN